MKTLKRIGAAAAVAVLLVALAAPSAPAADAPNAVINGRAIASGAFVPAAVNPNFDFSPVYSLSEITSQTSHGISAGFWPGFLADAFFFQYGYQAQGRSALGVAESQYPNPPHSSADATGGLGSKCGFGADFGIPQSLIDGCKQFWAAVGANAPFAFSAGRSDSDALASDGSADGARLTLPAEVTVHAVHSTTSTDARSGRAALSRATVVLDDVGIGTLLHIDQIRSRTRAVADGTTKGAVAERALEIVGATVAGNPVVIDETGLHPVTDDPNVQNALNQFAAEGIEIRLTTGEDRTTTNGSAASSGGLVVRLTRAGPPAELSGPAATACDALAQAQPPEVVRVQQDLGPNPLYDPTKFPQNQLPARLTIDQPVPPVFPCLGLLLDRAVDTGVVLGTSSASARFIPFPAPPSFDFDGSTPDQVITDVIHIPGTGSFVQTPPTTTTPVVVPAPRARFGTVLSAAAAQGVKTVYLVLMLLIGALVAGRAAFRALSKN